MPSISIITPSIRPAGVEVVKEGLKNQGIEFEHIVKLDRPGNKSTLCKAFNGAIRDAKGEVVIFLQDHIKVSSNAIIGAMEAHQRHPECGYTFPVGKVQTWEQKTPAWDWRHGREKDSLISYAEWEIDFGLIPKKYLEMVGGFDEDYDQGFGWENVDIAYRMYRLGISFRVDPTVEAIAWDHDAHEPHPFKKTPNNKLYLRKMQEIDENNIKLHYL